jgi:hypothetical protein
MNGGDPGEAGGELELPPLGKGTAAHVVLHVVPGRGTAKSMHRPLRRF